MYTLVISLFISCVLKRKSLLNYDIENINGDTCVMVIFYHWFQLPILHRGQPFSIIIFTQKLQKLMQVVGVSSFDGETD